MCIWGSLEMQMELQGGMNFILLIQMKRLVKMRMQRAVLQPKLTK